MDTIYTFGWGTLQMVFVALASPLLQGIIKKIKARLQNRQGPPLLQPYYDLLKYFKKESIFSEHSSWITRATPYITFCTMLLAICLLPIFGAHAPFGFSGDILVLIYLFGVARFFTALAALDAGSSFGGMGSSREMALGPLAEFALLLATFAALLSSGHTQVITLTDGWEFFNPVHLLSLMAMLIVVVAEVGRIPIDNPDTHLELTMIHEGMLLEYSGRYLSLMLWASQIKQWIMLSLFVQLFLPGGDYFSLYLLKMFALSLLLTLVETRYAKIRLFLVPRVFVFSMILSILAIVTYSIN
ncbi:MAG TPA: NADH-quinone oxidoreductase subunit H [Bacillota bacterium]|nr:NADH-quinone oxidoreductase subunit H [Bacillota bacterium]